MARPLEETPFLEAPYNLSTDPSDMRELISFTDPDNPERIIRLDMTFFLSRYGCHFGTCASNRPQQGMKGYGCCTESVVMSRENLWPKPDTADDDDVARIDRLLPELDDSIFANRELALKEGVYFEEPGEVDEDDPDAEPETIFRLRTVTGGCIFNNPISDDPQAPAPGCAFHHLALRKGVSHTETKPEVCWGVPLWAEFEESGDEREYVTVTGMGRGNWGGDDNFPDFEKELGRNLTKKRAQKMVDGDYLGYWCVDAPDAYAEDNELAYRYFENELTRIIGAAAYARLVKIAQTYERRSKMPGERVNGGKPVVATVNSVFAKIRQAAGA